MPDPLHETGPLFTRPWKPVKILNVPLRSGRLPVAHQYSLCASRGSQLAVFHSGALTHGDLSDRVGSGYSMAVRQRPSTVHGLRRSTGLFCSVDGGGRFFPAHSLGPPLQSVSLRAPQEHQHRSLHEDDPSQPGDNSGWGRHGWNIDHIETQKPVPTN